MENLTGLNIGHYQIVERLGEGGMAVVYRAFDTRLEREVAIKFIRTEAIPPNQLEKMLARFQIEAKALARLEHANIIRIFEFGEYDHRPYLVMNYLAGGTLKQYTGSQVVYNEAVRLLLPVARALDYAHSQGVVHRDVKPANILISRQGEPMLSDFGIARMLESEAGTLTGTGMGIGTPEYMAPEQWDGRAGPSVDIYALGVVFYELVTGRTPYRADTPIAILMKVMNDPLPRPASFVARLPVEVEWVLFKALAKNPADRYPNMGAMIRDMERLLSLESVGTPVPPLERQTIPLVPPTIKVTERPIEEKREKKEKWPVWVLAGGMGLLLICGLMILAALIGPKLFEVDVSGKPTQVDLSMMTLTPSRTATLSPSPRVTHPRISSMTPEPSQTATLVMADTSTPTLPPTHTPTTRPESTGVRIWQMDGMEQVLVPAGSFEMGSTEYADEKPVHTVYLDAFWLDKTEITNAMFARFVSETGYRTDAEKIGNGNAWNGSKYVTVEGTDWAHPQGPASNINGKDRYPVILVSWNDAVAYCAWAGKRLPTEAEWEKAARGSDGRTFPWGNAAPNCSLTNFDQGTADYCIGGPLNVGSYPTGISPYGALDMAGNVWEWVFDWYGESYYAVSPDSNPQGPDTGRERVIRGGGWDGDEVGVRAMYRINGVVSGRYNDIGFRCLSPDKGP